MLEVEDLQINDGLDVARTFVEVVEELAPRFGLRARSGGFDALPTQEREHLVAALELTMRRILMGQEAGRIQRRRRAARPSAMIR